LPTRIESAAILRLARLMANYTCPKHPDVRSDRPGNCSKCGMKLEERTSEQRTSEQRTQDPHKHR
jgi:hypothetical protein